MIRRTIDILDVYEGRDAAITFTLYFCCLLSGFYPLKSKLHRSLQLISKRLEDSRVVLRLYDDLTILRDFLTYELRPGVSVGIRFLVSFIQPKTVVGTASTGSFFEMFTLFSMVRLLSI